MLFSGTEIVAEFAALGITHVVWVPDSELGQWDRHLREAPLTLVPVCREGEAWPLAAGLLLAGASPIVVLQTTGLFESGDALRNALYDLQLPLFAVIGARSWRDPDSRDSARRFTLPMLQAWQLDCQLIESAEQRPRLREHYRRCREQNRPGAILLAE